MYVGTKSLHHELIDSLCVHRTKQPWQTSFYICLLIYSPFHASLMLNLLICHVGADYLNITVDDTSSDIRYLPVSSWRASGTPCLTCLNPNPSIAFNGTWHDGIPKEASARALKAFRTQTCQGSDTFCVSGFDGDDPSSSDTSLIVQFNFTGACFIRMFGATNKRSFYLIDF